MGIITRALTPREERATKITGAGLANPPVWMREFFGGMSGSATGIRVDEETAMRYLAVGACVTLLADVKASLPLITYRRLKPRGKERAPEHRLYGLLHDEPNPEMTSFTFFNTTQIHAGLWGRWTAEIEWGPDGWPLALWPLTPKRVVVKRAMPSRRLIYIVRLPSGDEHPLLPNQVIDVPVWSLDGGVTVLSPIGMAREAIALGLAQEEFQGRFYANDASPGIALMHPKELSDTAYERLRSTFEKRHQGLPHKHRMTILEEGMDLKQVGMPLKDAETLEREKFTRAQIASLYRIPPHMIGDTERSTSWGTGIDSQSQGFGTYTLRPWLVRDEKAIAQKLVPREERKEIFAEYLMDGLLRGDLKTRTESYRTLKEIGVYNSDDIAELENRNPLPDGLGRKYYVPLNWVPVDEDAIPAPGGSRSERRMIVARRSASMRRRLAQSYRAVFADVFGRIVRRERSDVMRAAERMLGTRGAVEFDRFVEDFYAGHEEYVRTSAKPALHSYAEAVNAEAAEEISAEPGGAVLAAFVTAYVAAFVSRWVGSSRGQVLSVAGEALRNGADPVAALQERFDEWAEKRPERTAFWESVQAGSAVTVETYREGGVTRKVWVGSGADCPMCQSLDGATIEITREFVEKGGRIEAEGAEPLVTEVGVGHPPLHAGCDCGIAAA